MCLASCIHSTHWSGFTLDGFPRNCANQQVQCGGDQLPAFDTADDSSLGGSGCRTLLTADLYPSACMTTSHSLLCSLDQWFLGLLSTLCRFAPLTAHFPPAHTKSLVQDPLIWWYHVQRWTQVSFQWNKAAFSLCLDSSPFRKEMYSWFLFL